MPSHSLADKDRDGCQTVLFLEVEMRTCHHIVLQLNYQQHTGLLAGQGDTTGAKRTITGKDTQTVPATRIVYGTGKDGIVEGALGQLFYLVETLTARGDAVQLLQGHNIGLLTPDNIRRAVVVDVRLNACAMLHVITHHTYLPRLARLILCHSRQSRACHQGKKGKNLDSNVVFHINIKD